MLLSYWCGQSKTLTETIAGPCVCSMHIGVQLNVTTCNSIVFNHFSVDSRKRIKTVVWTRIDGCVFNDNENALVWVGPKENKERMRIQSYLLFSILWPLVLNCLNSFIRIIISLISFYLQLQLCVLILEWWNMVIIHRYIIPGN